MTTMKEALQDGQPCSCDGLARGKYTPNGHALAATPKRRRGGDRARGGALCREPDAEAGGRSGRQPRGLNQHAKALPAPGAPWWQSGGHQRWHTVYQRRPAVMREARTQGAGRVPGRPTPGRNPSFPSGAGRPTLVCTRRSAGSSPAVDGVTSLPHAVPDSAKSALRPRQSGLHSVLRTPSLRGRSPAIVSRHRAEYTGMATPKGTLRAVCAVARMASQKTGSPGAGLFPTRGSRVA